MGKLIKTLLTLAFASCLAFEAQADSPIGQTNGAAPQQTTEAFTPNWDMGMTISAGIPKDNLTYSITLHGVYEFLKGAYAGIGAGWLSTNYSKSSYEVNFNYITVPLELGYRFGSNGFAIVPNVGADLNLAITKSAKYKGKKLDIDGGTFGIDVKVGGKIMIKQYTVGVSYVVPINDDMKMSVGKDGYVNFSIGFGI